jgi:hypothetical protein
MGLRGLGFAAGDEFIFAGADCSWLPMFLREDFTAAL